MPSYPQARNPSWTSTGCSPIVQRMSSHSSFTPDGPFRRADALKSGLTRRQLQSSAFTSFARGVMLPSDRPLDIVTRCRAARLTVPERSVFSHHTAAELYGIPAPRDALIHVSLISDVEPRITGMSAHRVLELPAPNWVHGLPVTTAGRTFVDLAAKLDLPGLVAAGDALAGVTGSIDDLRAALGPGVRRRGIRNARLALRFIDPRARSAPESHLRLLLARAGFPPDLVNEQILDEHGRYLFEPDLAYWVRLALEYEGRHHQQDPRQWESDVDRDARYRDERWHLIKVTSTMLYQHPERLVAQVAEALRDLGWRAS